jgi:excisionase family DNA binding protein
MEYTVPQFARLAGVTQVTVRRWIAAKSIRAVRVGKRGRFRIPASQLARVTGEQRRSEPFDAEATWAEIRRLIDAPTIPSQPS